MHSSFDDLKTKALNLSDKPGVYQFFDKDEKIIYVGKAKNLRKRVSSYFQKDHADNHKVRIMVSKIAELKYIVVDSESDALLLENNLIKQYQPRYNILLKDDKTFPWICVKHENFPRVQYTRNVIKDRSIYFGPYTSGTIMHTLLDFIRHLYPLRNCSLDLDLSKIAAKKYKTCLEFHLGNCKGPCVGLQSLEEYNANIESIKDILKGNISVVKKHLKDLMITYANEYKYEEAQRIKEKLTAIERFQAKSTVVNQSISNVEVFSIVEDENNAFVNYLRVVDGSIVNVHTIELSKKLEETTDELLMYAIIDIREKMFSTSIELIVPFIPEVELTGLRYIVPKTGDKLKLLEMSERNARFFMAEKKKMESQKNPNERLEILLNQAKTDLRLKVHPTHIECFDNSNLQGTNPVASCVVFKNLKPSKRDYRHFNVKTVIGADDFATMEEIVYRRYKRLVEEEQPLPQLIIIDGGKGQLGAALNSLRKLDLIDKIAVISIAKRLEELFFPGDPVPLYLDKNSPTLKVIQHLRNEAHRFGVTFHKQKRSGNFIKSELDEIAGIGDTIKTKLLTEFKSVAEVKKQSLESLTNVIGKNKAEMVFKHFQIK